jgi:hypothetical protein
LGAVILFQDVNGWISTPIRSKSDFHSELYQARIKLVLI